jgi:hypothetical protein
MEERVYSATRVVWKINTRGFVWEDQTKEWDAQTPGGLFGHDRATDQTRTRNPQALHTLHKSNPRGLFERTNEAAGVTAKRLGAQGSGGGGEGIQAPS